MSTNNLEKELDRWRHEHFHGKRDGNYNGEYLERESQLSIAQCFYNQGRDGLKKEISEEIDKQIAFYENSDPGKSEYCKGSDAGALEVLRWFKERL